MSKKFIFDPFIPVNFGSISKNVRPQSNKIDISSDVASINYAKEIYSSTNIKLTTPQVKEGQVVLITKENIGRENEIGFKLMQNFFVGMSQMPEIPQYIIFLNAGVRFTTEDSEVLDVLQDVQKYGTKLIVCKNSLNYYNVNNVIGKKATYGDITEKIMFSKNLIEL